MVPKRTLSLLIDMVTDVKGLLLSERDELAAYVANKIEMQTRRREVPIADNSTEAGTLLERKVSACHSVEELATVCGVKYNTQDFILECALCRSYLQGRRQIPEKIISGRNRNGFGYFSSKLKQAEMKHLWYAVKLHLKSQGHRWATDEAAAVKEAAGARRDVGLNVARTVYKIISRQYCS